MRSEAPPCLLLVFAHPDDEFAAFPWIEQAISNGSQVHAAWLTDGGWGGQSIARRQQESVRVLRSFGVRESHMHFIGASLGIGDGSLHTSLPRAVDALVKLIEKTGAAQIMAPAWEGGHQDHDASHLAACSASVDAGAKVWEYSLYHGQGLRGPFFKVLSLIDAGSGVEVMRTTLKQRVSYVLRCFQYRSQFKSFLGLLPFYAWRLRKAEAFMRRSIRVEATMTRPHAGPLLYERRTDLSWESFAASTAAYRFVPRPGDSR